MTGRSSWDNFHQYMIHHDGNAEGRFRPNGFYEESTVRDYPVRGRKMMFHVKRWDIVAEGTRISKKFAAFLKDMLGQVPDHGSLS